MKKLALAVLTTLTLLSCSKNDDPAIPLGEQALPVNRNNIKGIWYLKKVIQPDGSKEDYNNLCATKKDSVTINLYMDIDYFQKSSCSSQNVVAGCTDSYLVGSAISNCANEFDGNITYLSNKTMIINYGEVRTFPYSSQNFTVCKGLVLSRNR